MDPVGPWSAYATYNRLAGVQAGASSGDLHHHLSTGGGTVSPATTTPQILPGGFLSPPPVGYETVFSPLFHPATAKPAAHYVNQHRQALAQAQAAASKQTSEGEYHQAQAFFEQGASAWQQNSPFGILPHESVVAASSTKTTPYENFNAHFAAQSINHLNSQLNVANAKIAVARAQSPLITTAATKTSTSQPNSGSFFQVPSTFAGDSSSNTKSFSSANSSNLQQSCIVTSPSNTPVTKDYRVPQPPTRSVFLSSSPSRSVEKPFAATAKQTQPPPHIQTKAQTKIYPELGNQSERQRNPEENQSQSSPVSFSADASGRLNYPTNTTAPNKRNPFQHSNYRHYQQGTNTDPDFQRPKSGSDYSNTNGPDCSVAVPRKPSPLQAHSQASPLGHAPSPAYPMYNSPMNSMSSPQQNSNNQITPTSPLDVTVPRPNSQTGSVAYPSVITRALNSEKSFPERYERPPQHNQNNQNCWDERQSQARKFQTHANANTNSYNAGNVEISNRQIELTNRNDTPLQRTNSLNVTDRQQTYFDSGQVSLQDLSSCRGDPMSIVKNLQQQSCQVQQVEIKQEDKCIDKRRKSSDKTNTALSETPGARMDYFPGPIPPPAHSSGATQQQQNGGYFDFDRWNLPASASKIFTPQTIHQQHQGLMVPHPHHPPPPLPYFPPFHLAPHPPEFPTSVEITPINTYSDQSPQSSSSQFPIQEEQPKVVVPNIEEELNFLAEGIVAKPCSNMRTSRTNTITNKNGDKPSGPGAGFMNSYLKFLQGERDSSPPPPTRGGRKQSWSRSKTAQSDSKPDSNGVNSTTSPAPVTRLSQGDPQDDPRYFPLPKERKKNSFGSSDDGFSSDDDFFDKKTPPAVKPDPPPKEKPTKMRKGRPPKPGGPTERKRAKQGLLLKQKQEHQEQQEATPRRETSKRAAKEKSNIKQLIAKEEEMEEPPEFMDSDSDPAWMPQPKEEPEEEEVKAPIKKGKRGRPAGRKKGAKNLITDAVKEAGIEEDDGYSNNAVTTLPKRQRSAAKRESRKVSNVQAPENNVTPPLPPPKNATNVSEDGLFKPGEFVVIKSELDEEWPAIWRVDGKTLLQKYEPFEQNGQTLYRNISTYTSWTPESKKQYVTVPVKYRSQSHLETIVEFLKSEMTVVDQEFFGRIMKENEVYQDNFEVYIQTLISQALDSNFLTEIFQEQDDYFLSNVKTIDEITNSKKQKLLNLLRWPLPVQIAVNTWPCFNIIRELSVSDAQNKSCAACLLPGVSVRVLMYGQPYNSTTLEGCQPDPHVINEKDFLMCRICANRVQLFNKIIHQKYLMYIECAKRVAEKRTTDPHKDTTCILNELLADENWLNHLFLQVRSSWGEVDSLDYNYRIRNSKIQ